MSTDVFAEQTLFRTEPCSFHTLWKSIVDISSQAFSVFECQPTKDLTIAYNELNSNLCKAHGLIYRLTAFPCNDCPSLVRGNCPVKVVGEQDESTQVLVVYYMLRELLKNQLKNVNKRYERDVSHRDIIDAYIDGFEKFTAGVNLMKCIFTYVHGICQKVGLPAEHLLLPTEVLAVQLWTELVLTNIKGRLEIRVQEIVSDIRTGREVDIPAMESVKRLSLNLLLLHHSRQEWCRNVGVYSPIIEEPYISNMVAHYKEKKVFYLARGPATYLKKCVRAAEKEQFLATTFLGKQSIDTVRTELIKVLVDEETETFLAPSRIWLENEMKDGSLKDRKNLADLYDLLGGGAKTCWLEDVITTKTVEFTKEMKDQYAKTEDVPIAALRAAKYVHQKMRNAILETFVVKDRLLAAMLRGLKKSLFQSVEENMNFADSLAKSLAIFANNDIAELAKGNGNWIADIYGLLEKKDAFHSQYIRLLELRLLKNTYAEKSKAETEKIFLYEEAMVLAIFTKGKNFDFGCCCQRMLKDVYVNTHESFHASVILRPLILTKFMWNGLTSPPPGADFIPEQLRDSVSIFTNKFKSSAAGAGQCLTFLPHYSVAILNMRTTTPRPGNCELVVSLHQLNVAVAFNKKREWPVAQLQQLTGINEAQFADSVEPFVNAKILYYSPTRKTYSINSSVSPSAKLVLIPDVRLEVDKRSKVDDPRFAAPQQGENTYAVEGLVVKYLKTEGDKNLDAIQDFVCGKLEKHNVSRKDVKKALEKLIEREYLLRNEETKTFQFIP